jgi:hypothetical protein
MSDWGARKKQGKKTKLKHGVVVFFPGGFGVLSTGLTRGV